MYLVLILGFATLRQKLAPQNKNNNNNNKKRKINKQKQPKQTAVVAQGAPTLQMPVFGKVAMKDYNRFINRKSISEDGMSFLRAAFGSVDYAQMGAFSGIPDGSAVPAVAYRHLFMGDMTPYLNTWDKENTHFIILVADTPGVAFWYAENVPPFDGTTGGVSASTQFHPVRFTDFSRLFNDDSGLATENITAFRSASRFAELVPAMNDFSWTGNIVCKKIQLNFGDCAAYTNNSKTFSKQVTGLESCNAVNTPTFVSPTNKGAYSCAVNRTNTFKYNPVVEDMDVMNGGNPNAFGVFEKSFRGLGDLETLVITLTGNYINQPGGSGLLQPKFYMRCGNSVQYLVQAQSLLTNSSRISPNDPLAMQAYAAVAANLPVAVDYFHNAGFWDTLWNGIKKALGLASQLPGPFGTIAGLATHIANAGEGIINAGNKAMGRSGY